MSTAGLEAIGWGRRRSALHLEQSATDPAAAAAAESATREHFLAAADLAAQFSNPGHFAAESQSDAAPESVLWMDPTVLASGPPWQRMLIAGMRALVLRSIPAAA